MHRVVPLLNFCYKINSTFQSMLFAISMLKDDEHFLRKLAKECKDAEENV